MPIKISIDIETYSSVDIRTHGAYKYVESPDFEILLIAFAINDGPVQIRDLASGEQMGLVFLNCMKDPNVEKHAHNANFERICFRAWGLDVPIQEWRCTMVKAAYCGLPLGLDQLTSVLNLGDKGKLKTGKALIKYFCAPCKPTKVNGGRTRNLPKHDLWKWHEFISYCVNDVEAERQVATLLSAYIIPQFELDNYQLDQKINDRGILIDIPYAENACRFDNINTGELTKELVELTQLENPNSTAQLKKWLGDATGLEITTIAKDTLPQLIESSGSDTVRDVLTLRQKLAKTSVKKYTAMLNCVCEDGRAHGLFQFYGASRTGRWAGRLIQMQNLPQNKLKDLDLARGLVASNNYELTVLAYDDISSTLSQLIRPAFIAREGYIFAVADFSAIEARVIAWLADETWRLDVFNSHGKIYEASAAMMFNVPIEDVTKGSEYRAKGKIAELALGYQGAVGALKAMGGESMGLDETEMRAIVDKWREANPEIVKLWYSIEKCFKRALRTYTPIYYAMGTPREIRFNYDGRVATIKLPSGRELFYQNPQFALNRFGKESVKYQGQDQVKKIWTWIESYGGKFVENIVQAIARDLLADSMLRLDSYQFDTVMHVHDEAIAEVPIDKAKGYLQIMCDTMGDPIPWAEGLPLTADGYLTPYYKKD